MSKKPQSQSNYDELHDKYHKILTTKSGTRYERLAALVFKALEDADTVIHDLKLVGDDPEVKHQIDVSIENNGTKKRIVIECKDFDTSVKKVGIDILRSFRSVIEDTKADEGIVITCNGFTKPAQKYAKSKGIKLAILRIFKEYDMDGRIAKIIVGITTQIPSDAIANIVLDEKDEDCWLSNLSTVGIADGVHDTDPVFFVRSGKSEQFNTFLTRKMNDAINRTNPDTIQIKIPAEGWSIKVGNNLPMSFKGIIVTFGVDEEKHTIEVTSNRVAELILSGLGSVDLIIFGDQIKKYKINPDTGAVF